MKTFQLLTTTILATAIAGSALAAPTVTGVTGGNVAINGNDVVITGGTIAPNAVINTPGTVTIIGQASNKVTATFPDFSTKDTTTFTQPASGSVIINRVAPTAPTVFTGTLSAPGNIVLNSDVGATFTSSSTITPPIKQITPPPTLVPVPVPTPTAPTPVPVPTPTAPTPVPVPVPTPTKPPTPVPVPTPTAPTPVPVPVPTPTTPPTPVPVPTPTTPTPTPVIILPSGGVVTSGSAIINPLTFYTDPTTGLNATLSIDQQSPNVDIDWTRGFSSSNTGHIKFNMLASDVAINRDTSGHASSLFGTLDGAGHIVVINDAGIIFGAGGRTNVGALSVIAGKNMGVDQYGATIYSASGDVENHGSITAEGDVELFGNNVKNDGTITNNTNPDVEGDMVLSGNNITNTGTLKSREVILQNEDTLSVYDEPTAGLDAKYYSNNNTGAQTINAGGKIIAGYVALNSSNALAQSTINLTGIVDTPTLSASSSGDVNNSASLIDNSYTNLTAGRDVNSTATFYSINANLHAGRDVNQSGNIISSSATISADRDVQQNGSVNAQIVRVSAKRDVNFNAGGTLISNPTTSYADPVVIHADRDVNLNNYSTITSTTKAETNITKKNIDISANRDVNANGNIIGNIAAANQNGVSITAKNNANVNGYIYTDGLNIHADNDLSLNGTEFGAGNIVKSNSLTAGHNLTTGSSFNYATTGDTNLSSTKGDITLGGTINAKLNVYSPGNLTSSAKITTHDDLSLTAAKDVKVSGVIKTGDYNDQGKNVSISAGGKADLSGAQITTSKGQSGGTIKAGNLTVNSAQYQDSAATTLNTSADGSGGQLSVTATGDAQLNGTYYSNYANTQDKNAASIAVNANNYTDSTTTHLSGKNSNITANTAYVSGEYNSGGFYSNGGNLNFTTTGSFISTDSAKLNVSSYNGAGGNIKVDAKGGVYTGGKYTADADGNAGTITISGATISDSANTKLETTTSGNLSGASGGNITLKSTSQTSLNGTYDVSDTSSRGNAGNITITNSGYEDTATTKLSANGYNGGNIKITSTGAAKLNGNYAADGDLNTGKGGTIAVIAKSYADTANTKLETNAATGGVIRAVSSSKTNFKGQYQTNGKKKAAGSVYLYGEGATAVGASKVQTIGPKGAAKNFYYKTGGKVYTVNGDGK